MLHLQERRESVAYFPLSRKMLKETKIVLGLKSTEILQTQAMPLYNATEPNAFRF